MDLINKENSSREFYINGMILHSHSVYIYNRKKTTKKQNPPNPVLPNCTIEYLKKGNVNAIFTISRLATFFSNVPVLNSGFFKA